MTQLQILNLAYNGQLEIWNKKYEFKMKHPKIKFAEEIESKEWEKLQIIEKMIIEEERKTK